MTIYIIEVRIKGKVNWAPMYAPCYSFSEALAKWKVKARNNTASDCRIGIYQRVQE